MSIIDGKGLEFPVHDGSSYGPFDTELQDLYQFDAHYPPGVEIGDAESVAAAGDLPSFAEGLPPVPEDYEPDGVDFTESVPLRLQLDVGSGSYAEDGPIEVADNDVPYDGETHMVGSAAMYGPTEIGDLDTVGAAVKRAERAVRKAQQAVKTAPPKVAAKHVAVAQRATAEAARAVALGPYAQSGASEIGAGLYSQEGASEIGDMPGEGGYIAKYGQSEIGEEVGAGLYSQEGASEIGDEMGAGLYSQEGASEIGDLPGEGGYVAKYGQSEIGAGWYPGQGASEIGDELGAGLYSQDGASEIGDEIQSPFESFMLTPARIGDHDDDAFEDDEFDPEADLYHSSGGSEIGAIAKVVEKARDNRQPAPPMKAVDVDEPLEEDEDSFLADVVVGAAATTGVDQFPLLAKLLLRAGAATEPRVVRVDTEQSYKEFRTSHSPELTALREKLEAHIADPLAHRGDTSGELDDDIDDDINDLVLLGEEVKAAEQSKRVELVMPKRFDGKLESWTEGDCVCASIALPGHDGEVRICTTVEPIAKCLSEMSRHAAEAKVPPAAVVGALPQMGCVLGAGTMIKEMAAAAPAILARPEAKMELPFVVRIEPKLKPNLAALCMLAAACRNGDVQACDEWRRLGEASIGPVKQAMMEAVAVTKAAVG